MSLTKDKIIDDTALNFIFCNSQIAKIIKVIETGKLFFQHTKTT